MLDYEQNIMVTLTYNDAYLPIDELVDKETVRNFIKRFRKLYATLKSDFRKQTTIPWKYPEKIRYFAAAEYGKEDGRPHYHIILFGLGPEWKENIWKAWSVDPNAKRWQEKNNGIGCTCKFCRRQIEKYGMYPMGHIDVEAIKPQRAWYVTKYLFKKSQREDINIQTGEVTYQKGFNAQSQGLARAAYSRIIDCIDSNPIRFFSKEGYTESPVNCITVGKRKYPLGQYFRNMLKERLHVQVTEDGLIYCDVFQREKDAEVAHYSWMKKTHNELQDEYIETLKVVDKRFRRKQA
jgi:hypothetical protein